MGCSRWRWNFALNLCNQTYKETGKGLNQLHNRLGIAMNTISVYFWYTGMFVNDERMFVTSFNPPDKKIPYHELKVTHEQIEKAENDIELLFDQANENEIIFHHK